MPAANSTTCERRSPYVLFGALLCAVCFGTACADLPELGLVVLVIGAIIVRDRNTGLLQWCRRAARCTASSCFGVVAAVASVLLPWLFCEEQQLSILFVGAWGYLVLYNLGRKHQGQHVRKPTGAPTSGARRQGPKPTGTTQGKRLATGPASKLRCTAHKGERTPAHPGPCVVLHKDSLSDDIDGTVGIQNMELPFCASACSAANAAPTAYAGACEAVHAFIRRESPSGDDQRIANKLANMVRGQLASAICGGFGVRGIPCGNLTVIGESGDKPEIDIIVWVDTAALKESMVRHYAKAQQDEDTPRNIESMSLDMLVRVATRVLSGRLRGFRFWRSQFSGPEVKVVLMVPVELGVCAYPVRMNLSINTPYPIRLAHVLSHSDLGTKELILLVKRWAENRGLSKTNKGHLHPYAWSLLTINFLRSRASGEDTSPKSTLDLFTEFASYYANEFQRCDKSIVVSFTGNNIQTTAESTLWGIPYIEDPFECSQDVAQTMTADGVQRLKEELHRAGSILARGEHAMISELLTKWTPTGSQWIIGRRRRNDER